MNDSFYVSSYQNVKIYALTITFVQPASATPARELWTTFATARRASASARPTTAAGSATSAETATGTTRTAMVSE